MSIKSVKDALESFATTGETRAVVLKGDWGTGKTHLWNSVVKQKNSSFFLRKYCYVSLFGLQNLTDLKRAIFQNTVDANSADKPISFRETVSNLENFSEKFKRGARKTIGHLSDIAAPVASFGSTVDALQFASVRETLICIDDFERKSPSLLDKEILGLISNLVESKDCSVLLILNSNTLDKNSDYYRYNEKVFDLEISYEPTPAESAAIYLNQDEKIDSLIFKSATTLNITNIRLHKKISHLTRRLTEQQNFKDNILEQIVSTISIAVWSLYGSHPKKVDIEFIMDFTGQESFSFLASDSSEEEKIAYGKRRNDTETLLSFNYAHTDELDRAILRYVKSGHINNEELQNNIKIILNRIDHYEKIFAIKNVWKTYHGSYENNEDQILEMFQTATANNFDKMDISDIDSICVLHESLGKSQIANQYVDRFIQQHENSKKPIELDNLLRQPTHTYLQSQLALYYERQNPVQDPIETIREISFSRSHQSEDLKAISNLTSNEIYDVLKTLRNDDVSRATSHLLSLGSIHTPGAPDLQIIFDKIFIRTYQAILKIREESNINKLRTESYLSFQATYESKLAVYPELKN